MKKLTLEYIAGFVDGEGCFMIISNMKGSYCPSFRIANTNLQILEAIREYFSLPVKISVFQPKNPNYRTAYALTVKKIDTCKSIATLLEPYLRLKKEHAQIFMQFPRAYQTRLRGKFLTDFSTRAYVLKLRKRIRRLNRKRPSTQGANEDLQPEPDPQLNLLDLNQKEVI